MVKNTNTNPKFWKITNIVYCEDVAWEGPVEIICDPLDYTDEQECDDECYLSYSDKNLSELSVEEIRKIKNLYLVQRIGSMNPEMYNKLTEEQKTAFKTYPKGYGWLKEEDLPQFMKCLKESRSVMSLYFRNKEHNLKEKYGFTDKDLHRMFRRLKSTDIDVKNSDLNPDKFDYGDQILIFGVNEINLSADLKSDKPQILKNLKITMKIDRLPSECRTIIFAQVEEVGDK